ncbi:hypothetical protein NKH86_11915 [Mesorhizobium sp. M0913]|uniref:hypothetical protein n=1 Tax=Mesorhizobium sp. M0913 TaxID=2957026 RepID=UPI003338A513
MGRWVVLLPLLVLSGCDDGKEVAIAQCQLDEIKVFGPDNANEGEMWKQTDYVQTCMRSKGYIRIPTVVTDDCADNSWRRKSATCFRSAGVFGGLMERVFSH